MTKNDDQNSKVLSQFTRQASGYARMTNQFQRNSLRDRLEFIAPLPSDSVLDVACGTGRMALELATQVRQVTGLDLTPAMLEQAKTMQAEKDIHNTEWQIGDSTRLPFDDNHFSLVMCSAAFHHFAEPLQVLLEMQRVCQPGGRVFVMDVTPPADKSRAFDEIEQLRDPSHTHALTQDALLGMTTMTSLSLLRHQLFRTTVPLEATLSTSFPTETGVDTIREIYHQDAQQSSDRFGLNTRYEHGQLMVTYPMTAIIWRKPNY